MNKLKSFKDYEKTKNSTFKRALLAEKVDKDMIDILHFQTRLASALRIPKGFLDNE